LANARRHLGLSLVAAARRLAPDADASVLARRILRLEQGKRQDLTLAQALANIYGTTLAALIAETGLERLVLRALSHLPERDRVHAWRRVRDMARNTAWNRRRRP